jgi:hypothetical protein
MVQDGQKGGIGFVRKNFDIVRVEHHENSPRHFQERLQERLSDACISKVASLSINAERDGWLAVSVTGRVGGERKVRIVVFRCGTFAVETLSHDVNEWIAEENLDPDSVMFEQVEIRDHFVLVAAGTVR